VVGEWQRMTAAIVENGDLNLDNIFQRNNYEQTSGCDSLPREKTWLELSRQ
jgi:hypothetical protein